MRTIYKYPVPLDDMNHEHSIPMDGRIRHVDQQGCPCLWIEVETEQRKEKRRFRVFGTGHNVPDGYNHVGSCLDGVFVWHVFERVGAQ